MAMSVLFFIFLSDGGVAVLFFYISGGDSGVFFFLLSPLFQQQRHLWAVGNSIVPTADRKLASPIDQSLPLLAWMPQRHHRSRRSRRHRGSPQRIKAMAHCERHGATEGATEAAVRAQNLSVLRGRWGVGAGDLAVGG
jgi:hypothetical protein